MLFRSLVAAFRATLTEAMEADLLLHVVDAASQMREQQIEDVNLVLAEIGAMAIPQVVVYNKIDKLEGIPVAAILRNEDGKIAELRVSALAGTGMDLVRQAVQEHALENVLPAVKEQHVATMSESLSEYHESLFSLPSGPTAESVRELEVPNSLDTDVTRSDLNAVI